MTHVKTEQETEYDFGEYCPECDTDIPVVIDDDDMETYAVTCPTCGRKTMLCTLCHWDANDEGHDERCDWCPAHGCWRGRKEKPWWKQKGE